MAKCLMLWSLDKALTPVDPKERADGWGLLMEMIKQDMAKGLITDWGIFPSEGAGYCIMEGSNVDIMTTTEQYVPYVDFEHRAVASFEESLELIKNMSG